MKTPLIIGAHSTIGSALCKTLGAPGTTREQGFDLSLTNWPPLPACDVAYLCAAQTKLDACENDPETSRLINVTHLKILTARLQEAGAFVVFLSSNQVFSGKIPFASPTDIPDPQNEYGKQKAEFESWLLAQPFPSAILRLTKVISAPLPIVQSWKTALEEDKIIEAFDDLRFAPIPLSSAIEALINIGNEKITGISQLSGTRDISYYDIACLLADQLGVSQNKVVATSAQSAGIPANFLPAHATLEYTFPNIIIPPAESILGKTA